MTRTQAFVSVLCLTCAPLFLSAASLAAVIGGSITQFTLTSPNPSSGSNALLNVTGITTEIDFLPDGTSVSGSFPTAFIGGFDINRTPIFGVQPGSIVFRAGPASTILDKSITGLPDGGGALFELFSATAFVPIDPASFNTLLLTSGEALIANSSTLDLSQFSSGQLSLHLETSPGVNLAAIIMDGGTATGTGSFAENSTGFPSTGVPEPSTLLLLGVSTIGLLCCTWRWRRRDDGRLGPN
jgi:hypothetical protein